MSKLVVISPIKLCNNSAAQTLYKLCTYYVNDSRASLTLGYLIAHYDYQK